MCLKLLLFVDDRPNFQETCDRIEAYLNAHAEYPFELQVIEIKQHPHLVEHFRLVATPALVKIYPEPKQTLTGSNLIAQLQNWWSCWQSSLAQAKPTEDLQSFQSNQSAVPSVEYSAHLMQLSDQIFHLKQQKQELLEQLKFKDQILAMLAHDLRSPLTAASLAVETLELSENSAGQSHPISVGNKEELRKKLYRQAHHQFGIMSQMIAELLQTSVSMSTKLQIEPHQLDLVPLSHEIIAQMRPRWQRKSQQLSQDLPQDLPAAFANRELIRQVIVNLLDNAIKYTPEGGKISISIFHRTNQKIQVSICDTGLGIPEEKQSQIFEGHFRLPRDQSKEGYGLGLALCHQIVNAHFGRIWVDSNSDRGSCFHFTLPVYR